MSHSPTLRLIAALLRSAGLPLALAQERKANAPREGDDRRGCVVSSSRIVFLPAVSWRQLDPLIGALDAAN
eukprot:scaffold485_cov272-Pinguiococcus_pyrenoidosus.AAC.10